MLILQRSETFCASHRLFNPNWSEEKNKQIFGKCAHVHGHGHNYKLMVEVRGDIDHESGMVFNLQTLKDIIQTEVLADVDHKHLNFDVPWLKGQIPTTEVFVNAIWERLEAKIRSAQSSAHLYKVTVWETEKNSVVKSL